MPRCSCGKRSESIYCPLCESNIYTDKCPGCALQSHIGIYHPTCTVNSLLNAIKIRSDNSIAQQEVITERIKQMKEAIGMGQNYIRDIYQVLEDKFQALKLQWFGRKNESIKKSISSLYNILEERIIFGHMATSIEKEFCTIFQLTLSVISVWSYQDLLFKLSHSGNGCIIKNINADAYAWKKLNKKVSRKDKKLLKLITPSIQEYSIGMWPLETILDSSCPAAIPPSPILSQANDIVKSEDCNKVSSFNPKVKKMKSTAQLKEESNTINIKHETCSIDSSTDLDMRPSVHACLNELELSTISMQRHAMLTNNILTRNISVSDFCNELTTHALFKNRNPPQKCRGYFMTYPDITMNDTTSLFGSFLDENESKQYINCDPIYQLCMKETSWIYQAIATVVTNITAGIATTLSDLVVLGTVHTGQLSILKNIRTHTLCADCPSLIERCYVENCTNITGNMNLFITDAMFGDDSVFNSVDHHVSVIRFSIFEGVKANLHNVKLVANCVFTAPTIISGGGVYVSCYFLHLTLNSDFVGQCIGCQIVSLTTDPLFTETPLMFHKSVGPGLLNLSSKQDKNNDHIPQKSSSTDILPEDIDLNLFLSSRQNAYTRLIEKSPTAERMDSALDYILSREHMTSTIHTQKRFAKSSIESIQVDINLSEMYSNSDGECFTDNLLESVH